MITKIAKKTRCSQILAKGPHVVEGVDFVFLMTDVFPLHEDWAAKQGCGVSHVEVRRHGVYKSAGFFIVRTDGTEIDISYRVALDGTGTVHGRFCAAARAEIAPQIGTWKLENPAPSEGMQCDHVLPFDEILKKWLARVALKPEDVLVTRQLVGHTDLFLERSLALSWQRYHRWAASYQWLTAEENLRKSNLKPEASFAP